MNLSLCITVYNRYELLLESFSQVLTNDRITEIVIVDDCSEEKYWKQISQLPKYNDKIKVFRQLQNRGMSRNKADAISYASNEWCILFDSDNVIDSRYIDAIPLHLKPDTIYCPTFAWPSFDYQVYGGRSYGKTEARINILQDAFNLAMNTCNYVVNREAYLSVYKENPAMKGTDTLWFNWLWLQSNGFFNFMPDCTYFHRVHDGSGFMQDVKYNMQQGAILRKLISEL